MRTRSVLRRAALCATALLLFAVVCGASVEKLGGEARQLSARLETEGLTPQVQAELAAFSEHCRRAGGGYFPGAEQLARATDRESAVKRLDVVTENIEHALSLIAAGPDAGDAAGDRQAAAALLETIFAEGGYDITPRNPPWLALVAERARRAVAAFLDLLGEVAGQVDFISKVVLLIVLAVVLTALAILVLRLVKARRGGKGAEEQDLGLRERLFDSPEVHRKAALEFLERGDYRQAWRQFFLALLSQIEQLKLAAFDRSRTNREYVAQFGRRTEDEGAALALRELVTQYERTWYGGRRCVPADVKRFADDADSLVERVKPYSIEEE